LYAPVTVYRVKLIESADDGIPRPPVLECINTSKHELISTMGFELRDLRVIDVHSKKGRIKSVDFDENGVLVREGDEHSPPPPDSKQPTTDKDTSKGKDAKTMLFSVGHKYTTPEFFIRNHAFIAHLGETMSVVISPTQCLLLNNPSAPIMQKFLAKLNSTLDQYREREREIQRTQTSDSDTATETTAMTEEILTDETVKHTIGVGGSPKSDSAVPPLSLAGEMLSGQNMSVNRDFPFEFHCLEAVCKAVSWKHRGSLAELQARVGQLVAASAKQEERVTDRGNSQTYELREVKTLLARSISNMNALVVEFQTLLNTPKDIAAMCLTVGCRAKSDEHQTEDSGDGFHSVAMMTEIDEMELLLENYLWQFEEVLHGFELLLEETQMHERSMEFILDQTRNEIMKVHLRLGVLTCGFSYCAIGASIFGQCCRRAPP